MTAGSTRAAPGAPTLPTPPATGISHLRLLGRDVPWWVAILGVYVASRVLTTMLMLSLYVASTIGGWESADERSSPGFFGFSSIWDGWYYSRIAQVGYPADLPTDGAGNVEQNPWAFLPLYPLLVRALMTVTGLPFPVAAVTLAVLAGAGAALVLYRVVAVRAGGLSGLWATAFFCFGPLSFVLQLAYAESLFFLLMFAALLAMITRRYAAIIPFGVAAAFTKPGELAIPLALGIVFLVRIVRARRGGEVFRRSERLSMIIAGVVTAAAGLAWPFIAQAVTGSPGAYVETELSWWTGFIGRVAFVPLTPWFLFTWRYASFAGAMLVIAAILGYIWLLRRPTVKALGTEIIAYAASYALYLFAVFLPQQSLFRLLIPLAPLAGARGLTHSPRARTIVLVVGIVLQPVALILLWFIGYP
ncbi:hypothetical protein P5G50_16735 [Leifsonia sp. F6_8S_P_1B]|uniref:Mannosyltransferase PIG-V n=1 Tax=Leifsonia williamsii TaxID=3035919 RepID=A0ABT8KF65_9MICO|nr:hypothetical protein [Leifsonia williamsii]MDN4616095.1 hypothetical protein [Leifsonia williamsii]